MNKTVTVLLCKREEYSRQTLDRLREAAGREDWKVLVYCDIPGHQSDIPFHWVKPQIDHKRIYDLAKSYDYVHQVSMAPRPLGLKSATQWALKDAFVKHKSDLNLHLEDDVLIGPDALKFVEACGPYLTDNIGTVTLQGDCGEGNEFPAFAQDYPPGKVFTWNHFTCGWGWATTRKFFFAEFLRAPDQGVPASWAVNLAAHYKSKGFLELRSNARRSKNIGADLSTHLREPNRVSIGTLNCVDVEDEWTGGSHSPVWDLDFSELRICMRKILNDYLDSVEKEISKAPKAESESFLRLFSRLETDLEDEKIILHDQMIDFRKIAIEMDNYPQRRKRPQCLGALRKIIIGLLEDNSRYQGV